MTGRLGPPTEPGAAFDRITVESLRARGGLKWSAHPDALGAWVAEMDFGIAPPVARALHGAVAAAAVGYLDPATSAAMSRAFADWARARYGWDLAPDDVRPVADVLRGLELAIEHFSRPGSPVIVPVPAYMPFLTLPTALGRRVLRVPMVERAGRYALDAAALDAAYRAGGDLLVLCNPHNPTGRVLDRAELLEVVGVVDRHGGRVFADEVHAPVVFPGHRHLPYALVDEVAAGHAITATSASKAWNMPGLKCAQVVLSNDADRARWARIAPVAEHGAATVGVVAATAAYTAGDPWLSDVLAYLDGNRLALADLLDEHLPEVGYTPPEGTYLAWLDCRRLGLTQGAGAFFRDHARVAMTDGGLCGLPGFVRYTLATPRPVLTRAVDQMAAAVVAR